MKCVARRILSCARANLIRLLKNRASLRRVTFLKKNSFIEPRRSKTKLKRCKSLKASLRKSRSNTPMSFRSSTTSFPATRLFLTQIKNCRNRRTSWTQIWITMYRSTSSWGTRESPKRLSLTTKFHKDNRSSRSLKTLRADKLLKIKKLLPRRWSRLLSMVRSSCQLKICSKSAESSLAHLSSWFLWRSISLVTSQVTSMTWSWVETMLSRC